MPEQDFKTVGVVGLGLIGGSFAKAIRAGCDCRVFAFDLDNSALLAAKMLGDIDGVLNDETLPSCDLLLLALYPEAVVDYVMKHAASIRPGAVVIDCGGVKRCICEPLQKEAQEHGFCFIGGHPMAGTQFWGFSHARATLFKGASMILTPPPDIDLYLLDALKRFFVQVGFEKLTLTTPEEHDRIIAYTSQLAHVVSNAYVKSPTAQKRKGFSAGSFNDMTRVAKLNVKMWTELFLENADYLAEELGTLIENLQAFQTAIEAKDAEKLALLLAEGAEAKRKTL